MTVKLRLSAFGSWGLRRFCGLMVAWFLAKVVSGRSITKRSGFSRTNSVWSKGSLTSNTNRVFSGEAWSLMLLMVGLASAADAKSHVTIKP